MLVEGKKIINWIKLNISNLLYVFFSLYIFSGFLDISRLSFHFIWKLNWLLLHLIENVMIHCILDIFWHMLNLSYIFFFKSQFPPFFSFRQANYIGSIRWTAACPGSTMAWSSYDESSHMYIIVIHTYIQSIFLLNIFI